MRGCSNVRTACETGLHVGIVRTWRSRFAEQGRPGLAGLADRGRSGRPPAREPTARGIVPSCRPPPCADGWTRTRSGPGNTAPGPSSPAPASAPKPNASSTCTPAPSTASR
nr:hypothetical protein [Streptomyces sp. NRRL F-5755]